MLCFRVLFAPTLICVLHLLANHSYICLCFFVVPPKRFACFPIGMLLGNLVIARSVVGEVSYWVLLTLVMLFCTSFGAIRTARWCI